MPLFDTAREQIDLFFENFKALKLNEFHKYNDLVGGFRRPLSDINAYAYEGEMQVFKNCCLSKNKTVESIACKAVLRSMFKLNSREDAERTSDKESLLKMQYFSIKAKWYRRWSV